MGRLAVRKVTYRGDNWSFESPRLSDGLVVVEGPNGTGKSTFCDLIYFGLGGTVDKFRQNGKRKHKEITEDRNNFVELQIEIDQASFSITRYFNSTDIAVNDASGSFTVYPVVRRGDVAIFSDWLLGQLGIQQITFSHGTVSFILNVPELFRLIYHDQEPNPASIYKKPDLASTFVTDSRNLRGAIFENLLGKALQDYYRAWGEFKRIEKLKNGADAALKAFDSAMGGLSYSEDAVNLIFLRKMLEDKEQELARVESIRAALRAQPRLSGGSLAVAENLKQQVLEQELAVSTLRAREQQMLEELRKLEIVRRDLALEVEQITKIVFTHDQLKLFSPDTCPYCLKTIERQFDHCICGGDVKETEYQRFFYSPEEYLEILGSKRKNLATLEIARESYQVDLEKVRAEAANKERDLATLGGKLNDVIGEIGTQAESARLSEVDENILRLRTDIGALDQKIRIEQTRDKLDHECSTLEDRYKAESRSVRDLETRSKSEMQELLQKFNAIYNSLMTSTLESVKSAKIDDDYDPVINRGEYREVSSMVPVRLLYYFTLLRLSIEDERVLFPRFLLIDTPNTAGIDKPNLLRAIERLQVAMPPEKASSAQVILTTGPDDYPADFKKFAVVTLSKNSPLLQARESN